LFPPNNERLSLETCRGKKTNTLKKVKKVRQVGCNSRTSLSYLESQTKLLTHRLNDGKINETNDRQIESLSLEDRMATTKNKPPNGPHKLIKKCCTIWSLNVRLKVN
jgi:hypothetical protein